MTLEPMGDTGFRIAIGSDVDRATLLGLLRACPNVTDAVVTDHHALIRLRSNAPVFPLEPLLDEARRAPAPRGTLHTVTVRYDGPDIAEAARVCGVPPSALIDRHTAVEYTVELIGFLPGFAYLGPLDEVLSRVPRRATPRPRVNAGAVAIAAGRTAVYPFTSPGGWNLLGAAVDFEPFDLKQGARFALGDRVRFVPA